jgi:NAD(P)-dependent dehydrogenase (short-subunit alcohol dehydrogenase family)
MKKIFLTFLFITLFTFTAFSAEKNILIIGGSDGIGKALVELYKQSNYKVYSTFNTSPPNTDLLNNATFMPINLLDNEIEINEKKK